MDLSHYCSLGCGGFNARVLVRVLSGSNWPCRPSGPFPNLADAWFGRHGPTYHVATAARIEHLFADIKPSARSSL